MPTPQLQPILDADAKVGERARSFRQHTHWYLPCSLLSSHFHFTLYTLKSAFVLANVLKTEMQISSKRKCKC